MRTAVQLAAGVLFFALVASAQEQPSTLPVYRDLTVELTLTPTQFVSGPTVYYGGSLDLLRKTPVRLVITDGRLDIIFEVHGAFELLFSAPVADMSVTIVLPRSPSEAWWELWGSGRSDVTDYASQFDSFGLEDAALVDEKRAVSISWADRSALYSARFEMTETDANALQRALKLRKHAQKRIRLSLPTK